MYLYVKWMSIFTDFWLMDNLIFSKDYNIILYLNVIFLLYELLVIRFILCDINLIL